MKSVSERFSINVIEIEERERREKKRKKKWPGSEEKKIIMYLCIMKNVNQSMAYSDLKA